MKFLLIVPCVALGLSLQPAQAQDQSGANSQATPQPETLHAPTNRVGEMVPTMTAPATDKKATSNASAGVNKAETMHAPTNRVGKAVPTMRSAENKDDQTKSKTYYYGDDSSQSKDNASPSK